MNSSRNLVRLGTLYCVFCATAYTAYNVCLRNVAGKYDSAWINCVAAFVSATVFGVYLLWQAGRGRRPFPPRNELLALLVLGLITQVGGVLFVWSMSIVGVAVTGTLQMGTTLATAAILGFIVLGERVSGLQVAAISLITLSVVVFSFGAEAPSDTTARQLPPLAVLLGVGAAVLSGLAFGTLGVGVRKTVTSNSSSQVIVFCINLMGIVALGPWCAYRLGLDTLLHTASSDLSMMLGAGLMNLLAFFLVTKSLQLISVVRYSVLTNGLTTVLTAMVGIVLLKEPWNAPLLLGILLSIVGILAISLSKPSEATVALSVEPEVSVPDRQMI